jgi:hypothetical protein
MRTSIHELDALPLAAHALLRDVPIADISVIDLPGGGDGRTLVEIQDLLDREEKSRVVGALFALRIRIGRWFGWDTAEARAPQESYLERVPQAIRDRSRVAPGTYDGVFRVLYLLDRESLVEVRNSTVHAFLSSALVKTDAGYRLYWAVYVKKVSWFTPFYMAAIEPFRRWIVYPSMLRRLAKAWRARDAAGWDALAAT